MATIKKKKTKLYTSSAINATGTPSSSNGDKNSGNNTASNTRNYYDIVNTYKNMKQTKPATTVSVKTNTGSAYQASGGSSVTSAKTIQKSQNLADTENAKLNKSNTGNKSGQYQGGAGSDLLSGLNSGTSNVAKAGYIAKAKNASDLAKYYASGKTKSDIQFNSAVDNSYNTNPMNVGTGNGNTTKKQTVIPAAIKSTDPMNTGMPTVEQVNAGISSVKPLTSNAATGIGESVAQQQTENRNQYLNALPNSEKEALDEFNALLDAKDNNKLIKWLDDNAQKYNTGSDFWLNDIARNVGSNIPTAVAGTLAGAINPALAEPVALGLMGIGSYGGSANDALNRGYDIDKANNYGIADAASEFAQEVISPGVPGVGKVNLLGEGAEEAFGSIINPLVEQTLDENPTSDSIMGTLNRVVNPTKWDYGNMAKSFAQGVGSAVVLDAGGNIVHGASPADAINQMGQEFKDSANEDVYKVRKAASDISNYFGKGTQTQAVNIDTDTQSKISVAQNQLDMLKSLPAKNQTETVKNDIETLKNDINYMKYGVTDSGLSGRISDNKDYITQISQVTTEGMRSRDADVRRASQEQNTEIIKKSGIENNIPLNQINNVSRICNKLGIAASFTDDLTTTDASGKEVHLDGAYKNGTIVLSAKAKNPAITVLAHELTHFAESGSTYQEFRQSLWSAYENGKLTGKSGNIDDALQYVYDNYQDQLEGKNTQEGADLIGSETTAMLTQDLFQNDKAIQNLCRDNFTMGQKIYNWIFEQYEYHKDPELLKTKKLFEDALYEASAETAGNMAGVQNMFAGVKAQKIKNDNIRKVSNNAIDPTTGKLKSFVEQVNDFNNGKLSRFDSIVARANSYGYEQYGIDADAILIMTQKIAKKKIENHSNSVTPEMMQKIVDSPEKIVLAFKRSNGLMSFIYEIPNKISPYSLMAIKPDANFNRGFDVNEIRSIYGLEDLQSLVRNEKEYKSDALENEKSADFISRGQLNMAGLNVINTSTNNLADSDKTSSGKQSRGLKSELIADHTSAAKEAFGNTDDYRKAGFITKDGKYLDLSDGQDTRIHDHRDIIEVYPDATDHNEALDSFMNEGNIRIMPETGSIDLSVVTEPNASQYSKLAKYIDEFWGEEIFVDFSKENGRPAANMDYPPKTSARRIVNDIKQYYKDGTLPTNVSSMNRYLYSKGLNSNEIDNSLSDKQKDYFKNSQIRDENGNIKTVYHGSSAYNINTFDTSASGRNAENYGDRGTYFTDNKAFADEFAGKNGRTYQEYLNMANPLDLNSITDANQLDGLYNSDLSLEETMNAAQKAIDAGNTKLLKSFLDMDKVSEKYDGLISQIGKGKGNEYAVFNSNQIKNTDNLNPTSNADSRYSRALETKNIPEDLKNNIKGYQNIRNKFIKNMVNDTYNSQFSALADKAAEEVISEGKISDITKNAMLDYSNRHMYYVEPSQTRAVARRYLADKYITSNADAETVAFWNRTTPNNIHFLTDNYFVKNRQKYMNLDCRSADYFLPGFQEATGTYYPDTQGTSTADIAEFMYNAATDQDMKDFNMGMDEDQAKEIKNEMIDQFEKDIGGYERTNETVKTAVKPYVQNTVPTIERTIDRATITMLGSQDANMSNLLTKAANEYVSNGAVTDQTRLDAINYAVKHAGENISFMEGYEDNIPSVSEGEVRVVAEGDFNDFLKDITRSQKAGNKTYKDFKKAGFISTGLADKMFNAQSSAVDTLDKDLSTGNYINPIDYDPTLQMDGRKVQLPIVENSNEVKKQRRAKAIQMSDDIATICTEGRNYGTISKTIDQNMDEVAGKNQKVRKAIDNVIINPFYTAKTNYVNDITKYRDVLLNDVTKKYGITQGTKLSAALQNYAEGKRVVHTDKGVELQDYNLENLKHDFPKKWQDIVASEKTIRSIYDDLFNKINAALEQIYPTEKLSEEITKVRKGLDNQIEEKNALLEKYQREGKSYEDIKNLKAEITRLSNQWNSTEDTVKKNKRLEYRPDYITHIQEISAARTLRDIMMKEGHSYISNDLADISEWTNPNAKWESFMQHRKTGKGYKADAITAILDYMPRAAYKANIDPYTAYTRGVIREIKAVSNEYELDNTALISYMANFANDLAGKTNPLDRIITNFGPGGRLTIQILKKVNNFCKGNAVLGNMNSALAQFYNLPNAIAIMNQRGGAASTIDWTKGCAQYAAEAFSKAKLADQSTFLRERYFDDSLGRFDQNVLHSPRKLAIWIMQEGDIIVAYQTWYSAYQQAVRLGIENAVQYADEITRRAVAGRGVGEVPLTQKSELIKLIAPFQVEVNNQWQTMKSMAKGGAKGISSLILMALATKIMNDEKKKLTGTSGTGWDPFNAALDAYDPSKSDADNAQAMLFAMLGNTINAMPAANVIASMAFGQTNSYGKSIFGDEDPTRFGTGNMGLSGLTSQAINYAQGKDVDYIKLATNYFMPFGGKQAERTIKWAQNAGYLPTVSLHKQEGSLLPEVTDKDAEPGAFNSSGRLKYAFNNDLKNSVRGSLFGTNTTDTGSEYLDEGYSALGSNATSLYKELLNNGFTAGDAYEAVRNTNRYSENINGIELSCAAMNRRDYENAGVMETINKMVKTGNYEYGNFGLNKTVMKMNDSEVNSIIKEVEKSSGEKPIEKVETKDNSSVGKYASMYDASNSSTPEPNLNTAAITSAAEPTATPTATTEPKSLLEKTDQEIFEDNVPSAYYYKDGTEVKNSSELLQRQKLEKEDKFDEVMTDIRSGDATYADYGLNYKVANMSDAGYKKYLTNCKNLDGKAVGTSNSKSSRKSSSGSSSSTRRSSSGSSKKISSSKKSSSSSDSIGLKLLKKALSSGKISASELESEYNSLKSAEKTRYNQIIAQHKKMMNQYS